MKNTIVALASLFSFLNLNAQAHSHAGAQPLSYPNIDGYVSLKTDLHMHSVFSDGNVWPTIRVEEALRENLDAISLTEHLEYQPHKEDIPHPDRNRAYHLAMEEAKEHDLLIRMPTNYCMKMPRMPLARQKSKMPLYFGTIPLGMPKVRQEHQS